VKKMGRKDYIANNHSIMSKKEREEQKVIRYGEVLSSGSGFFFFLKPPGGV